MTYETIETEIRDAVGILTLNRPDRFNTFSTRPGQELNTSLQEVEKNPDVRVVVKGAGIMAAAEGVALFTEKRKPRWKGC